MDIYRAAKLRFAIHSARWIKKRFMGFSINGQIMHLFTFWRPKCLFIVCWLNINANNIRCLQ